MLEFRAFFRGLVCNETKRRVIYFSCYVKKGRVGKKLARILYYSSKNSEANSLYIVFLNKINTLSLLDVTIDRVVEMEGKFDKNEQKKFSNL
jgi:hypothetical protein